MIPETHYAPREFTKHTHTDISLIDTDILNIGHNICLRGKKERMQLLSLQRQCILIHTRSQITLQFNLRQSDRHTDRVVS